ncbi:MAG: peptidylprolyl isomerase [Clostridia bacterium]|nr:peptidylprolyl isomerase [Clostridia bacterium]
MSTKPIVEIEIQNYGTIRLELDREHAPISTENFVELAKNGFYDGLTFHRIIAGFMMQGGDPMGNGMGGSDKNIKGEFLANGVANPLKHTRGAISMARAMDPDSASSQFFIVHEDSLFLDGNYAVFGYVTDGIEVVDKVCETAQPIDQNGTILPGDQPKITAVRVL